MSGYYAARRGEQHHSAKLTAKKVRAMRRLHHNKKLCIRCIAACFDVKYTTAWDAISYNTWRHLRD